MSIPGSGLSAPYVLANDSNFQGSSRLERLRRSILRGSLPQYMTTQPTVTMGTAGAVSSITGSATPVISPASTSIATVGTLLYYNGSVYMGRHIDLITTPSAADSTGKGWGQAFETDSDKVEIKIRANSGQTFRFNVRVDGVMYSNTDITLAGDGTDRHILIDFGSAAAYGRRIELYLNASAWIWGYNISANRRIWLPSYDGEPLAMMYGDSYTDGVGSTNIRRTLAYTTGSLLGISNLISSGAGGTGYVANGSSANYLTRIADISRFGALDLLIVPGGINDAGQTAGAETAAVSSFWAAAMAAQPTAIMACIGPFRAPSLSPTQGLADAVKAGFLAVYDPKRMFYVDTYAANWQSGTGKIGATNGTGNSDFYIINSDGVHPSDDGHEYLGRNIAAAIRAGVAALN